MMDFFYKFLCIRAKRVINNLKIKSPDSVQSLVWPSHRNILK